MNSINFQFGEEDFRPGIIALVTPDGSARQVADGIAFPNGMVVTPDNKTLVVAESFTGNLTAFDIADDGSLSNRRVWAELGGPGGGDGICLDAEGAIWASVLYEDKPGCLRVREGGQVLERIDLERCLLRLHARRRGWPDPVHDGGGVAGCRAHGRIVQRHDRQNPDRPSARAARWSTVASASRRL